MPAPPLGSQTATVVNTRSTSTLAVIFFSWHRIFQHLEETHMTDKLNTSQMISELLFICSTKATDMTTVWGMLHWGKHFDFKEHEWKTSNTVLVAPRAIFSHSPICSVPQNDLLPCDPGLCFCPFLLTFSPATVCASCQATNSVKCLKAKDQPQ